MPFVKKLAIVFAKVLFFACLAGFFSSAVFASSWYASTSGSSLGNGSPTQPWDLCTAIGCSGAPAGAIQPGDTIWLAGGTYTPPNSNGFIFHLNGTSSA